ncbi:uncharacterized protein [Drosophila pseudoobscura]|uniref:Uncharacterized protein isoform X1 n=1 Tax=Drosophila pseudoobscura pseudoobscura TaxID=46245 RepID=A0A0R3NX55_DROPS|nr:uncharacterized protein LOC26532480 isoform X1 [Drosophila pseudoobscura]
MGLAACICTKILQLISIVVALIVKRLSDKHSERVYVSNQKQSREWRLLNSISGTKEGDDFSTLTFVGFTFISSVLLLTRIIKRNSNYDTCEIILLCFGCLFFTIEGLLILFTVEQLPEQILTYAYSLGALSFLCAALFAVDLLLFKNLLKSKNAAAQTDYQLKESSTVTMKVFNVSNADKSNCCNSSNLPKFNVRNEQSVLRTDL